MSLLANWQNLGREIHGILDAIVTFILCTVELHYPVWISFTQSKFSIQITFLLGCCLITHLSTRYFHHKNPQKFLRARPSPPKTLLQEAGNNQPCWILKLHMSLELNAVSNMLLKVVLPVQINIVYWFGEGELPLPCRFLTFCTNPCCHSWVLWMLFWALNYLIHDYLKYISADISIQVLRKILTEKFCKNSSHEEFMHVEEQYIL